MARQTTKRPRAGIPRTRFSFGGWLALGIGVLILVISLLWDTLRVALFDAPDHATFEAFLDTTEKRATYQRFTKFLEARGVAQVVPAWQLWRQGVEWRALRSPPFVVPPQESWGRIVPTLLVVRDLVIPVVGPVDVVSAYRTADYNIKAGGALQSRHLTFDGVDLVPRGFATRFTLQPKLLQLWHTRGQAVRMGLGLYGGTRFHIDVYRYRRW